MTTAIPPGSVYGGLTVQLGGETNTNPDNGGHGYMHLGPPRGGYVDVTLSWPVTDAGYVALDVFISQLSAAREDLHVRLQGGAA